MKKSAFLGLLILISSLPVRAQTGGTDTYVFLGLPYSARISSLGGKPLALPDADPDLLLSQPSLLNGDMEQQLALNFVGYYAGISYGQASYVLPSKNWGNLATGIQFINYGKFTEADETGIITGQFRASEYALHLVWSKSIDSMFHIGASLKPIFSAFERYTSLGLATDLGITYHRPGSGFTASLLMRNLGTQLVSYQGEYEPLPLEMILSLSQKLKYAPFRLHLVVHHLERYRLIYDQQEAEIDPFSPPAEDEMSPLEEFTENLLRHLVVGVEFMPLENFHVRAGYNYQRRKELQVPARIGTVGFSWGFGLKLSRFQISYGRATYHLAGASNHFSVSTRLGDFFPSR